MRTLSLCLLISIFTLPSYGVPPAMSRSELILTGDLGEKSIRTELYFGRNISSGGTINESEWQKFVDEVVTPRFPEGLTVMDADGQWRGKDGAIVHEKSKMIILLYPRNQRKTMNVRIEQIRAEYKRRFDQEAVMRIDVTKSVQVSF
ncbi:MAG: DUF3574 domain-containing protein [Pyrinomonadaceae bacterium]